MRLGILGGTFNPIHLGHLLLAECAREQCGLDRVLLIPTATPPHKTSTDLLDGRVRLALVRQAIRGHPGFEASDLELRLGGVSYTIRTVRELRRRFPKAKLFLIVGEDMLAVPWVERDALCRLCAMVVADRRMAFGRSRAHGTRRTHVGARLLGRGGASRLRRIAMPGVDISSSMIRERIRQGLSIRYLVPDGVARYIRQHRLYRRRLP